jgi:hypothetical protein
VTYQVLDDGCLSSCLTLATESCSISSYLLNQLLTLASFINSIENSGKKKKLTLNLRALAGF